jgi:acyl-CoA synthetase (NDP forming)
MSAPSSPRVTPPADRLDRAVPTGLDAIFRPRSVAVIGASRRPGSIGAAIFRNLLKQGFEGPVYPVNPQASVVQSVLAWPTVNDIPGDVDLAVIAVPSKQVLAAVEDCGRKGVRGIVVITAGFKETGAEGAERERAVRDCARRYHMRMVGPNCLGVLNTEAGVRLDATFAPAWPPAGNVAFSSQSGALGLAILETAGALGLGISHFVSVGNKADVSGNDLLEYWEQDPGTSTILLYLESFGNPRRFTQIARRVARKKPIVAVKSGRTQAGARAASSHTGFARRCRQRGRCAVPPVGRDPHRHASRRCSTSRCCSRTSRCPRAVASASSPMPAVRPSWRAMRARATDSNSRRCRRPRSRRCVRTCRPRRA